MSDNESGTSRADGRNTRWAAHRAERREKIVDAALELLAETGPEFGLEQVAARAGLSKPVIYRFFGDRATLIEAMGERATNQLAERMMPALYSEVANLARIRAVIGAFIGFLDESPNVYWLFARAAAGTGRDVVRAHKEFVASALAGVLSEYIRSAGIAVHPETGKVWAHGLVGFVQNTAEWWLETRTIDCDEVTEQLTTFVWVQIEGAARLYGVHLDPDSPFGTH
ncbi:TetR/AcrR family transcriptional regulator [Pseudonocardia endophytica]|uniref:TetR family transcriptional regulator n=1 Tax=Pseudonocardia endophytica TaxID=401976 RepID=A0A4V2PHM2_PSEEN|nr:TetR/AcrR family transcriptional regulator [Pseudonocardia endophytica]TCK21256.1 TetR family transcriptional regulator [Pseudonocardia endophytica]